MAITENIQYVKQHLPAGTELVAVSKTHSKELIEEAYNAGIRDFGENKVQELVPKAETLPEDIRWHMIGHLQRNKVKYIAPFIYLIHSIDSFRLLKEVNKQAKKNNRTISCLLQIHIASEESKHGLDYKECREILNSEELVELRNIKVAGLMGMATNTGDIKEVQQEFAGLKTFFDEVKETKSENTDIRILSMGMSSDYQVAIEEGSNMVRVGSSIFGKRPKK